MDYSAEQAGSESLGLYGRGKERGSGFVGKRYLSTCRSHPRVNFVLRKKSHTQSLVFEVRGKESEHSNEEVVGFA